MSLAIGEQVSRVEGMKRTKYSVAHIKKNYRVEHNTLQTKQNVAYSTDPKQPAFIKEIEVSTN